jgi:hypothetical protein
VPSKSVLLVPARAPQIRDRNRRTSIFAFFGSGCLLGNRFQTHKEAMMSESTISIDALDEIILLSAQGNTQLSEKTLREIAIAADQDQDDVIHEHKRIYDERGNDAPPILF